VRASWLPANIAAALRELEEMNAGLKPCATAEQLRATAEQLRATAEQPRATAEQPRATAEQPYATSTPESVAQGFSPAFVGRAAVGAGHIRIDGDTAAQARAIEQLRGSQIFGNVVVVRGDDELKARVDVWGSHGERQPLFDSLKRAFDPHGVLNAGRGPL
jgi:hypothetical protein